MKRKLIIIYATFLFIIITAIILQSCCKEKVHRICDINFHVSYYDYADNYDTLNKDLQDYVDTSFHRFVFDIQGTTKEISEVCHIPFVTTCYAFQPCLPRLDDSLLRRSLSLSLDRAVTFNNTVIAASSNLFTHPAMAPFLSFNSSSYYDYTARIQLDSASYSKLQIDTGYYNVSLYATTSLGKSVALQRQVLFKN